MILKPSFGRMARMEYGAAVRWYDKHRRGLGAEFETEIQRALAVFHARRDPLIWRERV